MKNLCVILTDKGRNKIKEERIKQFGSQMVASEDIGISQTNIPRWERGSGDPTYYQFVTYLRRLGIYKDFLTNKEYVSGTKYKGFEIKKIRHTRMSLEKAYILGVVGPGDGFINGKYQIGLKATDKDFVDYFHPCLENVFGLKCKRYFWKDKRPNRKLQHVVRLCSKSAAESFRKYKVSFKEKIWRVPEIIKNSSSSYKAMYLKGIFDSQGCVNSKKRFIKTKIYNEEGIKELHELLRDLNIGFYVFSDNIHGKIIVQITGIKNLKSYYSKIGFVIKRKMESLKNALNSYKQIHISSKEVKILIPKMIELRNSGLSYRKIASEVGVNRSTIRNNLRGVI